MRFCRYVLMCNRDNRNGKIALGCSQEATGRRKLKPQFNSDKIQLQRHGKLKNQFRLYVFDAEQICIFLIINEVYNFASSTFPRSSLAAVERHLMENLISVNLPE